MLKTPVVGRDAELAQLRQAVTALADGTGGCLLVDGPAGIGKSRLVAAAAAEAAGRGVAVGTGAASPLDRVAPLASLLPALASATPPVVSGLHQLGDASGNPLWLIDRVEELLQEYTRSRPLLVVIDDLQWVDELTALALRFLVPGLSSSPVLWLLTRRLASGREPGGDLGDRLLVPGGRRLTLGPLTEAAVAEVCRQVLGAPPDRALVELATRSGGNPFLLEELLLPLLEQGGVTVRGGRATAVTTELPSRLRTSVEHRLTGLSDEARRLLEAGSVLARPFPLDVAATTLGLRPVDLLPATSEAIRADVLVDRGDGLAFRHDLIREAVYDAVPGPVRRVLHRQAAIALQSSGGAPTEVAEHLVRGSRGDAGPVVAVIEQAVAAYSPTAPGTAADLIVRALDVVGPDDPARAPLAAQAVRLLARVGRVEQARELGEAALGGAVQPAEQAALLLGLTEALKHAGQDAAAVEYSRRALAQPDVPDAVRGQLLAIRAHALVNAGSVEEAAGAADAAVEVCRAADLPPALVMGLAALSTLAQVRGDVPGAIARAQEAVALADRIGGEARHQHPRLWLGHALAAADRFAEAAAVYETGQREADRLATAWSQPLWHHHRAELWLARGMLADAKAEAEAGARIADQLGTRALSVPLLSTLAAVAMRQGDLDTADRCLEQAQRLADSGFGFRLENLTWRRALLQDRRGRPRAAVRTLAGWWAVLDRRVLLLVQEPCAGPRVVRIALRAGARHEARAVAERLTGLLDGNPAVASLAGAAAHADGLLRDDVVALRSAVEAFRSSPRPLARASALEDLGRAEHARGDTPGAVAAWEEALDLYSASGALPDVTRVRRDLEAAGVRPPAPADGRGAGLTPSEARVAGLVAEGRTNREIARELFLSPHTVDSHLRHVFQKLGIASRVALTRWVVGGGLGTTAGRGAGPR